MLYPCILSWKKTPDALLKDYFELLTNIPLTDIPENPREAQKSLALEIISQFQGKERALTAQKTALEIVSKQNMANAEAVPEFSLSEVKFPAKLFYILNASNLVNSSGEGRRQIQGGSVRLDGDRITDPNYAVEHSEELADKILQVGKKKFIRLVP